MAETTIFQTREDFKMLVSYILSEFDAKFVTENSVSHEHGEIFGSYREIESFIDEPKNEFIDSSSFYIVSDLWSIEPIFFTEITPTDKKFKPFYCAQPRYGGPSIKLSPSYFGVTHNYEKSIPANDKKCILAGSLSDYPYYISGSFLKDKMNGYRTIDRPQSMNVAMKKIKRFIRNHGEKVVHRNENYVLIGYAMNDALRLNKEKGIRFMTAGLEFE